MYKIISINSVVLILVGIYYTYNIITISITVKIIHSKIAFVFIAYFIDKIITGNLSLIKLNFDVYSYFEIVFVYLRSNKSLFNNIL